MQEFQVVAAGYSAEFGRSTGGLVNAITKSGTNSTRGSALYVNRNRDWAEKNAFGQTAAPTQQQFGGSVGGPLVHDRLFYFAAVEQQLFENTRNVVFNLTGVNRTADTQEAYDYYKSLEEPFDTTNDATALLGRVDYQVGSGSRIDASLQLQPQRGPQRQRRRQRPLGHHHERALQQRHREGRHEHPGRAVHVGPPLQPAVRSAWAGTARGTAPPRQRPRAHRAEPGGQLRDGELPRPERPARLARADGGQRDALISGTHTFKIGTEYNHVDADQLFGFNQFGR